MIRSHSQEVFGSSVWVEIPVLAFREDTCLRRGDEDLGDSVEGEEHQRLHRRKSVAEIDKSCDENEEIEDNGSHVAERHSDGGGGGGRS